MERKGQQDHYEVLSVSRDAPDEVIRAAYKALAAKYHPDRNPGDQTSELKLKRLNAALRVLGDPEKRKQYDELTSGPEDDGEASREPETARPTGESVISPPLRTHRPRRPRPDARGPETPARESKRQRKRTAFQTALRIAGTIASLSALVVGGLVWYESEAESKFKQEQAAVTVTAEYDPADCRNPKHPIRLTIVNSSSDRTIKSVALRLEAYEEGHSDNLVTVGEGIVDSTRVVRPKATRTQCWKLPSFTRAFSNGVTFRARKDFVEFYHEDEPIPPEPASTSEAP